MEEVGDAMTSEGACEVVDIEVEVVSTITALLGPVGTGTAPGAVDRTAGEVEMNIIGEAA